MNPYALSGLFAGFSSVILGVVVLIKCGNRKLGFIWFLFALTVANYEFGVIWFSSAKSQEQALWAIRWTYLLGVIWIASLYYHFISVFLDKRNVRLVLINYSMSLLFCLLIFTPLFYSSAPWAFNSMFFPLGGKIFPLFFVWWIGLVIYSHLHLYHEFKSMGEEKKNQVKYFFLATAVGFTGGSMAFLPDFGIYVYPWGNFTVILYPLIMAYAIVKHHLMDINVALRKSLVYSLMTGVLTTIYLVTITEGSHILQNYFGASAFIVSVVSACFITAIFLPVRNHVQSFVDKYFFRDWSERGEMVREVAAGFSHELKSPLAGLSMQAQMALAELQEVEDGKESWLKALPRIKKELEYLVNQSMDAARRIEAVRGVAEPIVAQIGPVDVHSVIDSALTTFAARLEQVNVGIHRDIPADLPPVRSNEKQLEIVFINLIKNALDAMEGDNKERQSLYLSGQIRNESVMISVKDTGPGIANRDVGRIFEPYYSTKGRKGTGMGLYLTQQIIKAHNGSIEVRSEEGKGTEFIVTLQRNIPKKDEGSRAA